MKYVGADFVVGCAAHRLLQHMPGGDTGDTGDTAALRVRSSVIRPAAAVFSPSTSSQGMKHVRGTAQKRKRDRRAKQTQTQTWNAGGRERERERERAPHP